jgi:hypothetical protein
MIKNGERIISSKAIKAFEAVLGFLEDIIPMSIYSTVDDEP